MSKVIRIDTETFSRLQSLAEPFVDTPSSVIQRLLDYYESRETNGQEQKPQSSTSSTVLIRRKSNRGQNLFLAPASEENLRRTITRTVSLSSIENLLTPNKKNFSARALRTSHCSTVGR